MPDDAHVLVASATVVFAPANGAAASPEDVAAALLAQEEVSTVRISAHGEASAFRVDVGAADHEAATDHAGELAHRVAHDLGLGADVVSVGLLREEDRVEVFRVGEAGDEPTWGKR